MSNILSLFLVLCLLQGSNSLPGCTSFIGNATAFCYSATSDCTGSNVIPANPTGSFSGSASGIYICNSPPNRIANCIAIAYPSQPQYQPGSSVSVNSGIVAIGISGASNSDKDMVLLVNATSLRATIGFVSPLLLLNDWRIGAHVVLGYNSEKDSFFVSVSIDDRSLKYCGMFLSGSIAASSLLTEPYIPSIPLDVVNSSSCPSPAGPSPVGPVPPPEQGDLAMSSDGTRVIVYTDSSCSLSFYYLNGSGYLYDSNLSSLASGTICPPSGPGGFASMSLSSSGNTLALITKYKPAATPASRVHIFFPSTPSANFNFALNEGTQGSPVSVWDGGVAVGLVNRSFSGNLSTVYFTWSSCNASSGGCSSYRVVDQDNGFQDSTGETVFALSADQVLYSSRQRQCGLYMNPLVQNQAYNSNPTWRNLTSPLLSISTDGTIAAFGSNALGVAIRNISAPSPTLSPSTSVSATISKSPSASPSQSSSRSYSFTFSNSPSASPSQSSSRSYSFTFSNSPTMSPTPSSTASPTPSSSLSSSPTESHSQSASPSLSPTAAPTSSSSPSTDFTSNPSESFSGSPTNSATPTATSSITPTSSVTPKSSVTPTSSETPTSSASSTTSVTSFILFVSSSPSEFSSVTASRTNTPSAFPSIGHGSANLTTIITSDVTPDLSIIIPVVFCGVFVLIPLLLLLASWVESSRRSKASEKKILESLTRVVAGENALDFLLQADDISAPQTASLAELLSDGFSLASALQSATKEEGASASESAPHGEGGAADVVSASPLVAAAILKQKSSFAPRASGLSEAIVLSLSQRFASDGRVSGDGASSRSMSHRTLATATAGSSSSSSSRALGVPPSLSSAALTRENLAYVTGAVMTATTNYLSKRALAMPVEGRMMRAKEVSLGGLDASKKSIRSLRTLSAKVARATPFSPQEGTDAVMLAENEDLMSAIAGEAVDALMMRPKEYDEGAIIVIESSEDAIEGEVAAVSSSAATTPAKLVAQRTTVGGKVEAIKIDMSGAVRRGELEEHPEISRGQVKRLRTSDKVASLGLKKLTVRQLKDLVGATLRAQLQVVAQAVIFCVETEDAELLEAARLLPDDTAAHSEAPPVKVGVAERAKRLQAAARSPSACYEPFLQWLCCRCCPCMRSRTGRHQASAKLNLPSTLKKGGAWERLRILEISTKLALEKQKTRTTAAASAPLNERSFWSSLDIAHRSVALMQAAVKKEDRKRSSGEALDVLLAATEVLPERAGRPILQSAPSMRRGFLVTKARGSTEPAGAQVAQAAAVTVSNGPTSPRSKVALASSKPPAALRGVVSRTLGDVEFTNPMVRRAAAGAASKASRTASKAAKR